MKKILFVSDIHLNLRKNKEWEYNRFMLLGDLLLEQNGEILILGGDIFDKANPTLDELAAFYEFIAKLKDKFTIYIISGNHEDLSSRETTFHKLPELNYIYYEFTEKPIKIENWYFYFVSHHRINEIKKVYPKERSVLFSHIRASIGIVKEEIPLRKYTKDFDYVFLGDIHIPYQFNNICYCGSPYTIVYEPKRNTKILLITINKKELNWEYIDTSYLPQKVLLQTDVKNYNKLLQTLSPINLYKIRVNTNTQSVLNLENRKNVQLEILQNIDENVLQEQVELLQKEGQIDVYNTLFELLKTNDLSEEHYDKAYQLLLEIQKK